MTGVAGDLERARRNQVIGLTITIVVFFSVLIIMAVRDKPKIEAREAACVRSHCASATARPEMDIRHGCICLERPSP